MKTQMKSDALLDAFIQMELTKNEMENLKGGDSASFDWLSSTGTFHGIIDSHGNTTYYGISLWGTYAEISPAMLIYLGDNDCLSC